MNKEVVNFFNPVRNAIGRLIIAGTIAIFFAPVFSAFAVDSSLVTLTNSTVAVQERPAQFSKISPHQAWITRKNLNVEESAEEMDFEIALKMRNFDELQKRINKGELISSGEMAEKYLPTVDAYNKTVAWATNQGLTVTHQSQSRLGVFVCGKISHIQQTFRVHFSRVIAEGKEYSSATNDPSVPSALSPEILGINGLQPQIRPHRSASPLVPVPLSANASPYYYYCVPSQLAQIYKADGLYNLHVTGAGETIAIVMENFPNTSDLSLFWQNCGINQSLTNINFIQVVSGTLPTNLAEATIDVEWASSIAPGAKVWTYGTVDLNYPHLNQAFDRIKTDAVNHPELGLHQVSMSFGIGETYINKTLAQTEAQYIANLASIGVTLFAASGDGGATPDSNSGSSGPVQACWPACDINVTGVGGTSISLDSQGYFLGESAWSLSGGGTSIYFNRPGWQIGNGVPAGAMRVVPDVASGADPNAAGCYLIMNGLAYISGGTSWGTPVWAGFNALFNQIRASANLTSIGNLNSKIYPLIGTANFRDITSGSNGYTAGAGYDLATGIGVPNVQTLAQTLAPSWVSSSLVVLHQFGDGTVTNDGSYPSRLVIAKDGNLYGITTNGGTAGCGTVFKMTPQGAYSILHHFSDGSTSNDGINPGCLLQAADGNFYGSTIGYASNNYGIIFKISSSGQYSILNRFDYGSGGVTGLVQGNDGNFYGTTGGWGSVFKMTSEGGLTVLHTFDCFTDPHDGLYASSLTTGNDGRLYGTTTYGGTQFLGTVYTLTTDGLITTLHSFGDGVVPGDNKYPSSLVQGKDGFLYGIAGYLDTPYGLLFRVTPGGLFTLLHQFGDGAVQNDGKWPTLISAGSNGNIYGGTSSGGAQGYGTIFSLSPQGTYSNLYNFDPSSNGLTSLVQSSDGTLYGTASSSSGGILFKLLVAPSITSTNSVTFALGKSNSFSIASLGSPACTYSINGLPSWVTFNTASGVLNGTPTSLSGSPYTLTISAANGVSVRSTQIFTLNVQTAAAPIIINGPAPTSAPINVPYNFTYQASGVPAPAFTLSSGALPPGLTLGSNGILSGSPTRSGVYTGAITALNGMLPNATQNFSITVPASFTQWASSNFTPQQFTSNASNSTATPLGDSTPNLLKYLFDINPAGPMHTTDRSALPKPGMVTVGSDHYLTLTYRQNPATSGITTEVQTSTDLLTWQEVTPDSTQYLANDVTTGDPIIQVRVKATGTNRLFIRLNVTTP